MNMDKFRPISVEEKLSKTSSIWLLGTLSRTGAVHILKDREAGNFVVRKSSHPRCLALSVQSKKLDHSTVDHFLIEGTNDGFKLQGSVHFFHSVPSLLAYYVENIDEIPYNLQLPVAIQQAKSARELASLDMLGQDFWVSSYCRTSQLGKQMYGTLYKSCSEPADVQRPIQAKNCRLNTQCNISSVSASDFSHLMKSQLQAGHNFSQQNKINSKLQTGNLKDVLPKSGIATLKLNDNLISPDNECQISVSKIDEGYSQRSNHRCKYVKKYSTTTDVVSCASNVKIQSIHQFKDSGKSCSLMEISSSYICSQSDNDNLSNISPHDLDVSLSDSFCYLTENNASLMTQPESFLKSNNVICDSKDITSLCQGFSQKPRYNNYPTKQFTNQQLVDIPENTYFTSNLSDKLSDYEDVWRSSCSEDEDEDENVTIISSNSKFRSINKSGKHKRNDKNQRRKGWRKLMLSSQHAIHESSANKINISNATMSEQEKISELAAVEQADMSNLTALEQAWVMAGCSIGEQESKSNVLLDEMRTMGDISVNKHMPEQSFSEITKKLETYMNKHSPKSEISTHATSSGDNLAISNDSVVASQGNADLLLQDFGKVSCSQTAKELPENDLFTTVSGSTGNLASSEKHVKPNRRKPVPSPLRRFSRKKSSSESSLANIASPLYAEPADTVRLKDKSGMALNIQVKRCSAPVASSFRLNETVGIIHQPELFLDSTQNTLSELHSENNSCTQDETFYHTPNIDNPIKPTLTSISQAENVGTSHELVEAQKKQIFKRSLSCFKSNTKKLTRRFSSKFLSRKHSTKAENCNEVSPVLSPEKHQPTKRDVSTLEISVFHRLTSSEDSNTYSKGSSSLMRMSSVSYLPSIQDLISCAYPELAVKPASFNLVKPGLRSEQPLSPHYDNLQVSKTKSQLDQVKCQENQHQLQQQPNHPDSKRIFRFQRLPNLDNDCYQHNHQKINSKRGTLYQKDNEINSLTASPLLPPGLSSFCPDVVTCHNTSVSPGLVSAEIDKTAILNNATAASGENASTTQNVEKIIGEKIQEYIFMLSRDNQTLFGRTVNNFIQCTIESQERSPQVVMRNVRQFMTGIKNYLIKHGEGNLNDLIEMEREMLGNNEILNVDAVIEQALDACVLKPVTYHIYSLLVEKYSMNGSLEKLSRNIKFVRQILGHSGKLPGFNLPKPEDMKEISHFIGLMQRAHSPFQKLQYWLKVTNEIHCWVQGKHGHSSTAGQSTPGADDVLPMMIYVIAQCGLVSAEIEADIMWSLLQPSHLSGESGYCLAWLSSTVMMLKNYEDVYNLPSTYQEKRLLADVPGFLKIAIPSERHSSIIWQTFPVLSSMNTKDTCALIAYRLNITNLQDYGLFWLKDDTASQISDTDYPHVIKETKLANGESCILAFKRIDANIAWPKNMKFG